MLKSSRDGFFNGLIKNIQSELDETKKALQEKGKNLEALGRISSIIQNYL